MATIVVDQLNKMWRLKYILDQEERKREDTTIHTVFICIYIVNLCSRCRKRNDRGRVKYISGLIDDIHRTLG
jgi:hypothetical protein